MVSVMSFSVGLYFWLVVRPRVQISKLDVASVVASASKKIRPMTRNEIATAAILLLVIALWILQ